MNKILSYLVSALSATYLDIKQLLNIDKTIFKLDSGEFFCIRNNDRLGRVIYTDNNFEVKTRYELISSIATGMTVIDIGANIGYYTVQFANIVGKTGKIYAFEPNPIINKLLIENINLNNYQNVIVENIALSNSDADVLMHLPNDGYEAHGSMMPNETFVSSKTIISKAITLDDYVKNNKINSIDLIKIDTEGAELLVFNGAHNVLKSMKPKIVFECAEPLCKSFNHSVIDVLSLLKEYGYKIEEIEWGSWKAE